MRKLLFISICMLLFTSCDEAGFKEHKPCSFTIRLPQTMELKPLFEGESIEKTGHCDYEVLSKAGHNLFTAHAMDHSQFESTDLNELYEMAIRNSKFKVKESPKDSQNHFFVIEGTNPENGNKIFWKRVIGKVYISDLYFNYPESLSKEVKPYLKEIADSFTSD